MNSHYKEVTDSLDQLIIDLMKWNGLRQQFLVELQYKLEDVDRINNSLTYQKKLTEEIAFQNKKNETHALLDERYVQIEKIREQEERSNLLWLFEKDYYDRLKKIQEEDYLLSLEGLSKKEKEMEQIEQIKKAQQQYIKTLFETVEKCNQQILYLIFRIKEVEDKINKCEKEVDKLDKIILDINEKIIRNNDRILLLDNKISLLDSEIISSDKIKDELLQDRHKIIAQSLGNIDKASKINLSFVQSNEDRIIDLIQIELVRKGRELIEVHHTDIIQELNMILIKKEKFNDESIKKEINNIVRKIIEDHCKKYMSEENIIHFMNKLINDPYYIKEVENLISEIVKMQALSHNLNSNLDAINTIEEDQNTKIIERTALIQENDKVKNERDKLKEEVSVVSDKREKIIEEIDTLKQEHEKLNNELDQTKAVKSDCEKEISSSKEHQKLYTDIEKEKISRLEKLKQLKKARLEAKEAKKSTVESSKSSLIASKDTLFAVNNKESTPKIKTETVLGKNESTSHNQDARNDSSFPENRGKKLG